MIYYGDEVGLPGNKDPDCRRCMEWDPAGWNTQILDCYRQMAALRASQPVLRRGKYESLLAFERLFVFRRFSDDGDVIIVLNAGNAVTNIAINTHSEHSDWVDYHSGQAQAANQGILTYDFVPARTAIVLIGNKPVGQ